MKFYKETNFQETPIGKIPKDWEIVRATDVAEYINGYPFSPKDWKTSGIPIIRIQNLNDPNAEFNFFDGEIDEIYKVKNGDLLFSWSASIGVYIWKRGDAVLNQHIFKVIPKPKVNKLFLYYALFLAIEQLKRRVHGSTMKHFRRGELETTFLPFPPLGEQQKIAEILSTVDEAIQKTDEIIAKTERLKKALMNELLTGRIRVREENGRLSFYRETELQETEIGKIPREWKTVKLSSIARIIMGQSPPSDTYNREGLGMPFLQGKMEFGRMYPSPTTYTTQPLKIAEPNDILISVRAPVGDVNIAPYKVCIGRGLAAIRFNLKTANHMFYFYYFQYIKKQLETLGKGSTFKAITKKDLEELLIPLPPIKEQEKVSGILTMIDKTIELYHEEREGLERLKRGLMDLLLTGKVRVVDGDVGS